jgi:signal transduction histidine kinase
MKNGLVFISFFIANICFAQQLKITKFQTNNGSIDSIYTIDDKSITLDFRQSNISIFYQDLADSTQANYEIWLVGFDKKWRSVYRNTYANYTNLAGGDYEFRVRNLRFFDKMSVVKFKIENAFWQSAWFIPTIVAYILLVAGIIFYFFQHSNFRQQLRLQKVRNDISADLHDDVGATLSNISFLTEIAKSRIADRPQEVPILLDKILSDAKDMIQTMRGMIWTISPNNDNAIDFFVKIENLGKEVLTPHNITFNFDSQLADNQSLNIEVQRHLFLVFKEAFNNITKYAKAKKASITIRKENEWLMIQIKDDGVGFDLSQENEGNGLRNMRNRTAQLNGNFELKSDVGTRLRLSIPLT